MDIRLYEKEPRMFFSRIPKHSTGEIYPDTHGWFEGGKQIPLPTPKLQYPHPIGHDQPVVMAQHLVVVSSQPSLFALFVRELIPVKNTFKLVAALKRVIAEAIHALRSL
jgi:hypothetical protein